MCTHIHTHAYTQAKEERYRERRHRYCSAQFVDEWQIGGRICGGFAVVRHPPSSQGLQRRTIIINVRRSTGGSICDVKLAASEGTGRGRRRQRNLNGTSAATSIRGDRLLMGWKGWEGATRIGQVRRPNYRVAVPGRNTVVPIADGSFASHASVSAVL